VNHFNKVHCLSYSFIENRATKRISSVVSITVFENYSSSLTRCQRGLQRHSGMASRDGGTL